MAKKKKASRRSGEVLSNEMKDKLKEMGIDGTDLNKVLKGKAQVAYRRLKKQFDDNEFDTNVLKVKIDDVEDFYNKNSNELTDLQRKRITNYIVSLNNIFYSKGFDKTFIDASGKVQNTFVGVKQTRIPSDTPTTDNVSELFDLILSNKPRTMTQINNDIFALNRKELNSVSREIRRRYGDRVPFSNRDKPTLQQDIMSYIENVLIDKEKLTQLKEDIGAFRKGGEYYGEFDKVTEKIEKVKKGEAIELGLENPVQEEIYGEIETSELAGTPFDIDTYIKDKLQIGKEEQITKFLLTYDDKDKSVKYAKSPITPQNYSKRSIRDTFDKILLNNIYINRLGKAIQDASVDEVYKQMDGQSRSRYINDRIQHQITPADLQRALQDPQIIGFMNTIQGIIGQPVADPTIESYHEASESIRGLKHSDDKVALAEIAKNIIKYSRIYDDKEQNLMENIKNRVNVAKGDIRILPEGIKIRRATEEQITTDLDKYTKIMKEISELKKIPILTPAQQQKLENLQFSSKQYVEGSKKELAQKKKKDLKTAAASKRSGNLRPHFTIPNSKAVVNEIGETAEQQIRDIKNWYIFDNPDYNTGVGNKLENPLVKQNSMREWAMVDNTTLFTNTTPYLLSEGVDERKDFAQSNRSQLNKVGVDIGLQIQKWDETEDQFIQRFNSESNGLFDVIQSKEEVSDFQNIYQIPQGNINNKHPPQWTNNRQITRNDKEWISNMNLFYKGAVIN